MRDSGHRKQNIRIACPFGLDIQEISPTGHQNLEPKAMSHGRKSKRHLYDSKEAPPTRTRFQN